MKHMYVIIFLVIRFGYNLKQKIQELQVRLRTSLVILSYWICRPQRSLKLQTKIYILKSFIL